MAVSKRSYRAYAGELAPTWSRFLVVTRYGFGQLFQSKMFISLLALCFLPFLLGTGGVYLANSETARVLLNIRGPIITIDAGYFVRWLQAEGWIAVFVAAYVGPNLVSSDLANGALPLYLSRPLSRTEYVLGKGMVLGILLSCITWAPLLIMYGLQVSMAEPGWFAEHWTIGGAIVISSLIWIAFLALVSLAMSAWVRWRIIATALTFAIFMIPPGIAQAINLVLRTRWGNLVDPVYLITRIWYALFDVPLRWHSPFGLPHLPVPMAWLMLLNVCALCVWMLNQRLRAREVVRG